MCHYQEPLKLKVLGHNCATTMHHHWYTYENRTGSLPTHVSTVICQSINQPIKTML